VGDVDRMGKLRNENRTVLVKRKGKQRAFVHTAMDLRVP
jgi:hypothetical protein